jgi:hypothetical protein
VISRAIARCAPATGSVDLVNDLCLQSGESESVQNVRLWNEDGTQGVRGLISAVALEYNFEPVEFVYSEQQPIVLAATQ